MKQALMIAAVVCGLAVAYGVYALWLAPGRGEVHSPGSVKALVAALKSSEARTRRDAAWELRDLGEAAAEAVPALTDALRDPDEETRFGAALALEKIKGAEAQEAAPVLISGLKSVRAPTRIDCAYALVQFPAQLEEAVPLLLEALEDRSAEMRRAAAYTLVSVQKPEIAAKTAPVLGELLKTTDEARADYAYALQQLGPLAKDAESALRSALNDKEAHVRRAAAFALVAVVGEKAEAALPALLEALKNPDEQELVDVVDILGKLGSSAKPALPQLRDLLKSEAEEIRKAAGDAIKNIAGP